MSAGNIFLRLVGVGECRRSSVWFMIAIFAALIGNMVVLIGCMSPSTQPLYLFRVGSNELVRAAANLTSVPETDLRSEALPSYWYWGLSGMCVAHNSTGETMSCIQSFPPVMGIEDMVTFGIRKQLGVDFNNSYLEEILSPWNAVLAELDGTLIPPSRSESHLKGAAALSVLSTIVSFLLLPLTVLHITTMRDQLHRWMLYIIAFIDATFFIGAAVLADKAINDGPRELIHLAGTIPEFPIRGPSSAIFAWGSLLKLLSIEIFLVIAFLAALMTFWLFLVVLELLSEEKVYYESGRWWRYI
ncbi:hypothetical protein G7Z17_g3843 [Cylindrodendrum hubeiense]|uniref:Uncharacterized protein n=1 Tax=Cylindrodendrum hubeiense TaxID=595255 RepID=A0A9P5HBS1_9HYPO|nr:hypothetical protein G7Z17_g3843 [Cylindrodendrum hubeiense]